MNKDIENRIRGTILASACANSLGGASLGLTRKEIMFAGGLYGFHNFMKALPKSLLPDYRPGDLLSDTLAALKLSDSLIANHGTFVAPDFKQRLSELLAEDDFLNYSTGAHCLLQLRKLTDGEPIEAESDEDSSHVSAAARAYPAGCLPAGCDIAKIAVEQARLSHPDDRVAAAAAVLARSVSFFVSGKRLDDETSVRHYVKEHFEIAAAIDERFAEAWDDIAPDLDYISPARELPYSLINVDSHVTEAVPTAVGIFLIFRHNLEEAVSAAASAGGDTDTVAAIVGALSGAYHGASAIPEHWLKQISQRERLEAVADQLIALWKP